MTADREGLDRLKQVLAEVEASLPPAAPRRGGARKVVWTVAAAALVVAVAAGGRALVRKSRTEPAPVEVLSLRIDGRDARAEMIDSSRAGSIVVVARPGAAASDEGGARR